MEPTDVLIDIARAQMGAMNARKDHEIASWAHAHELWRRRALAAEAERDELRAALAIVAHAMARIGAALERLKKIDGWD